MISRKDKLFHRKIAVQCFNGTWDYLVKKRRTVSDELQMLDLAHTSHYHWNLIGNARNRAIGDWQLSRVYSILNEPGLALKYAKSCFSICKKYKLKHLIPSSYEIMARAYAVSGNHKMAKVFIRKARRLLEESDVDEEGRKLYLGQISETEKLIRK